MVSNWQTISSRSRKISIKLTTVVLAAALFLTGVTPSFADDSKDTELKPSAYIHWNDAPAIEGTSAILVDAGSGDILYEKNAYEKRDPASITKIMTCLVVLETMELDDEVTAAVSFDDANGSIGIDIKKGEVFTVEQLLYALMLSSANDAAEVLAIAAGGTIDNFCDMMNERAERCGAKDTNFTNPNGMNVPLQPEHRTTAYDITLMAKEAMKNETFRQIVGTVEYKIPKTNMSKARNLLNINRCLSDGESDLDIAKEIMEKGFYRYEGTIGVKTGYTSTAGSCFCGWAQKDDTDLIAVVLNSSTYETRFEDVIALWDYGFSKYYTYPVLSSAEIAAEIPVKHGEKSEVNVGVSKDLDITLNVDYDGKGITTEIDVPKKLAAPIKKGTEIGRIIVYKDGEAVASAELQAMEDVEKGGVLSYVGIADEDIPGFLIGLIIIIVVLLIIKRFYKKEQYRKKRQKRARINRSARRKEWEKEKNPFD